MQLPPEAYMAIKDSYAKLQKKHNLPDFDRINNEFEISLIEKEDFLLRAVRRKMADKMGQYAKFLEDLLQPDTSFASMNEARDISDEDKQLIFELFQKLMFFSTSSVQLDLECEDAKDAEFISRLYDEWLVLKKQLHSLLEKIKLSWTMRESRSDKAEYMG